MNRKRRLLVLSNEAARHPFRASLPPQQAAPIKRPRRLPFGLSRGDARDFLMAFCATFVVVSAFIA
jgi:hypothetical protein